MVGAEILQIVQMILLELILALMNSCLTFFILFSVRIHKQVLLSIRPVLQIICEII